jgi:hypothetical protein
MNVEELDQATRDAVERVVAGVREALSRAESPHLLATSHSFVLPEATIQDGIGGGDLLGPGRPPFQYDRLALAKLHESALLASSRSSGPRIHNLIVRATRTALGTPWDLQVVLVSHDEYASLRQARAPIDQAVFQELRAMHDASMAWVMFGRQSGKPPRLARKAKATEELEPSQGLLAQLSRTDELYRGRGLELVTLVWTVDAAESVNEYFR